MSAVAPRPRKSLVAGKARKDRFGERRPRADGESRTLTSRRVSAHGRKGRMPSLGAVFSDSDDERDGGGGGDDDDDDGDQGPDFAVTGDFGSPGVDGDEEEEEGDEENRPANTKRKRNLSFASPPGGAVDAYPDDLDSALGKRRRRSAGRGAGADDEADADGADDADSRQTPAAATSSRARKTARSGSGGVGRARRRQTLAMIAEAKALGIVSDGDPTGGDDDGGDDGGDKSSQRRSGRKRFQPMQYWKNERLNYTRSADGLGNVLCVVDDDNPIIVDGPVDRYPSPTRAFRKQPAAKKKKKKKQQQGKGKKKQRHAAASDDDDSDDDDGDGDSDDDGGKREKQAAARVPLSASGWVYDAATKSDRFAVIAKSEDMLRLETIRQAVPDAEPGDAAAAALAAEMRSQTDARRPRGCKAFEESGFAGGLLTLPPLGVKYAELASSAEVFYVAQAAPNALVVEIHQTRLVLSKGDQFFVPPDNVYMLRNTSETKGVKLFFTLVKQ